MLIYVKCPKCSEIIGRNYEAIIKERIKISNDPNLTHNQKDIEDGNIIKKYGFTNICCMAILKTQIRADELIPNEST